MKIIILKITTKTIKVAKITQSLIKTLKLSFSSKMSRKNKRETILISFTSKKKTAKIIKLCSIRIKALNRIFSKNLIQNPELDIQMFNNKNQGKRHFLKSTQKGFNRKMMISIKIIKLRK